MYYHKSLLYFSAILAILETLTPSYAMELSNDGIDITRTTRLSTQISQEELLGILTKAQALYTTARPMQVSLDKVKRYGDVITLIQPYGSAFASLGQQNAALKELPSITNEMLADSFQQKGIILHKFGSNVKIPTPEHITHLSQALICLKESYTLYRKLQPQGEQTRASLLNYTTIGHDLGQAYSVCAEKEKDPAEKISTYLKSLKAYKDSYKLRATLDKMEDCRKGLMLTLKEGSSVYFNTALYPGIFQESESTKKYQSLTKNIALLKDILTLFESYLTDSFVPFEWTVKEDKPSQQKSRKGRGKANASQQIKQKIPLLNPEDCVPIIASTYCGMLKGASHTVTQLPTDNSLLAQTYQVKRQEHLDLAFNTYKEKVYKGEYANDPEKVGAFISARLEALAGNEEPIKDFYRTLRQDYQDRQRQVTVRHIKEEQEERRIQEEREHQRVEEAAYQQQALLHQSKPYTTTTTTVYLQVLEKQPEEKYKVTGPRIKLKTRGTPYSTSPIETKQEETPPINKQTITLEDGDYHIFQSLTGEIYDKHITLKEVLHLLKEGLKCTLSLAGGSHNKATASNNKMWTIPRPWDGPIPAYYHGQLMDFLLYDMGIVSGELEVQVRPKS